MRGTWGGALIVLFAQGCGDDGGGAAPRLAVTVTNPAAGESGVPIDRNIAVAFSRPLDPATADSITVSAGGQEIAGQITCTGDTVIFVTPELDTNTVHTVTVSTSVRGAEGETLAEAQTFEFTTGGAYADGSPPRVAVPPFGAARFYTLVRKAEILLLGADYESTNSVWIDPLEFNGPELDNSEEVLHKEADPSVVVGNGKVAMRAILDGDPEDEVVVVSWPASGAGSIAVLDGGASFSREALPVSLAIDGQTGAYRYQVTAGDVDLDGLDEIVVAGVADDVHLGHLWIFDDRLASFGELYSDALEGDFAATGFVGVDRVAVATGNLDGDPAAEVAVAYHIGSHDYPSFAVLDDAATGFALLHEGHAGDVSEPYPGEYYLGLAAGDFDGDGLDELALGLTDQDPGCPSVHCPGTPRVRLLDDASSGFAPLAPPGGPMCGHAPQTSAPTLHAADIDGDHVDEIIAFGCLVAFDGEGVGPFPAPGRCGDQTDLILDVALTGAVAVDDINGDFRDDIIVLHDDGAVTTIGCRRRPRYNQDTGELESVTNYLDVIDDRGPYGAPANGTILATPNVDNDSIIAEYGPPDDPGGGAAGGPVISEAHTIHFADNRIIAVLAAAPCAEGIGQNTEACSTGFGTSVGGSFTAGVSTSVRAGAFVGISEEITAGFLAVTMKMESYEAEVRAEVEATAYMSATVGMSQTITNYAGPGEDLVVFFTVPYDRYTYSVVSHPDGDLIGEPITFDIPQRPKVLSVSREYYNATNGEQMDIGGDILPSTPGDLSSYVGLSEVPGFLLPPHLPLGLVGPQSVNQGAGKKDLQLELDQSVTVGGELTLSVDSSVKMCGTVICGGTTSGVSIGAFAEVSLDSSMVFTSSVGAIDADHFATELYDYGMFAYMKPMLDPLGKTMQSFLVVNYWVD